MMVTITNRNKRKDFRTFFKEYGLPVFLETIGRGTAQSEVLDYFGLEESEKLLFLAIVTGETWKKLRRALITKMLIDVPGTGVSFIVPLSSVGGRKTLQFLVNEQEFEKEEETAMKDTDYELLVAIANQGYIDTVMDAARSAKAGGGTVIHAKGTGMELAKKYLGVSLVEEKEVILIVTSFSILFARYKGNLGTVVHGARALDTLEDGDTILISEGCTHHRQCDDIGTVKLPRWVREYTGKDIDFEFTSGTEFPLKLNHYKMIIHCGGCMLNEREMKYRLKCAGDASVPITNYGTAIAYMKGILERSIEIFPQLRK